MTKVLPEGWVFAELRQLSRDISYGYTASAKQEPVGPKFLRITDLQHGSVDWSRVPHCECENLEKYLLKTNDIVVARTGATTGKSFLIDSVPGEAVFASYLIRIQLAKGISPAYLAKFMQSDEYWRQITVVKKGSAQPGANASALGKLQIPIAPSEQQHGIVTKLDALFSHSRKAKQALEAIPPLLERYRQSVLAAACSGRLTEAWRRENPDVEPAEKLLERIRVERRKRWEEDYLAKLAAKGKVPKNDKWKAKYKEPEPVDTEGLPELPGGWCWISIKEITQIRTGKLDANAGASEGQYPFFTCAEEPIRIDQYAFDTKAVLLAGNGAFCTNWFEGKFNAYQRTYVIEPFLKSPKFFLFLLRSLLPTITQNNRGSTIRYLRLGDIADCPCPLPPNAEQEFLLQGLEKLVASLDRIEATVEEQTAQLSSLMEASLASAFQGRLLPQNPNDEPASALLEKIKTEREAQAPKKSTRQRKRVFS